MPPLPDVPGVLRCDFRWNDAADTDVSNRMFFQYTGGTPSAGDCGTIAGVAALAMQSHAGLWTPAVEFVGCTVTDLASNMGASGINNQSAEGTLTGTDLAGGTALCISFAIARRYRGGRPRVFLPWGSSTSLATRQSWNSGFTESAASAINAVIAAISGSTSGGITVSNHVNVSYYQGFTVEGGTGGKRAKNVSTLRETPLVNPIVSTLPVPYPSSQRRRNR